MWYQYINMAPTWRCGDVYFWLMIALIWWLILMFVWIFASSHGPQGSCCGSPSIEVPIKKNKSFWTPLIYEKLKIQIMLSEKLAGKGLVEFGKIPMKTKSCHQRWNLSMPSLFLQTIFFCQQCKFLHFHSFFVFFLTKLLKLGEIDGVKFVAWKSGGVKFWTNSMSGFHLPSRISRSLLFDL